MYAKKSHTSVIPNYHYFLIGCWKIGAIRPSKVDTSRRDSEAIPALYQVKDAKGDLGNPNAHAENEIVAATISQRGHFFGLNACGTDSPIFLSFAAKITSTVAGVTNRASQKIVQAVSVDWLA